MSASYPFLRAVDQTSSSIAMLLQNAPGPSTNVTVFIAHTARYQWESNVAGGYAEVILNSDNVLELVATVICKDNLLAESDQTSRETARIRSGVPVPITVRVTVDNTDYDETADTVVIFP